MIICYTVPEIWRVTDVIFIFHFGIFFPFTHLITLVDSAELMHVTLFYFKLNFLVEKLKKIR